MLCSAYSPPDPEVGPRGDVPAMKALLSTLWLALACGSVHTTLSKSDAKKAASKTLLEKVSVAWGPIAPFPACWGLVPMQLVSREAGALGFLDGKLGTWLDGVRGSSFWGWAADVPGCTRPSSVMTSKGRSSCAYCFFRHQHLSYLVEFWTGRGNAMSAG